MSWQAGIYLGLAPSFSVISGDPHRPRSGARPPPSSEVRGEAIHIVRGPRQCIPRCPRSGARPPPSSETRDVIFLVVRASPFLIWDADVLGPGHLRAAANGNAHNRARRRPSLKHEIVAENTPSSTGRHTPPPRISNGPRGEGRPRSTVGRPEPIQLGGGGRTHKGQGAEGILYLVWFGFGRCGGCIVVEG